MEWLVFLIISAMCLIASIVFAFIKSKSHYKRGSVLDPSKILFIGTILSSVVLFIPVYWNTFRSGQCGVFETILISIHNMIRLFIVDVDFDFVLSNVKSPSPMVLRAYTLLFSVLFVLAPILTFGFVLSFFKNISAYKRYFAHYNSNVFVFSELNEKSLALATSLSKKSNKRFFVFTDVFAKEEELNYELVEKAKELGAVCFKKDVVTIDFSFHSKKSDLNFFVIGEDYSENISQSLKLLDRFKYRDHTNLYVFSTQIESEMLLSNAFGNDNNSNSEDKEVKIRVRRVNEVQSLIVRNLYDNGYDKVFKSAYNDGTGIDKINAVVIGMGQHGTEMTKALAWFCQMDGYLVEINAFDIDPSAEERFTSLCPELMKLSGKLDVEGESKYTINIHSGVDVTTSSFDELVLELPRTTYVFVALGNDESNISTAVKLRSMFERKGHKPEIQAVVYNSDKKEALAGIKNFKGQAYNIDFIGDMKNSYSEEVILNSTVEEQALERHLKWGNEREFWQYDYNYKSSVASAIHYKMKVLCDIPGIKQPAAERSENDLWNIRILEHCRWNAYMRSEGYMYSGSIEKSSRNDIAKMHHCLVPFAQLPLNEQEKDDD